MGIGRTSDEIIAEARKRGEDRGRAYASQHGTDDDPPDWLSGEMAGESIPELLGDLIDECKATEEEGVEDWADEEVCTAYEDGADDAFWEENAEDE